MGKKPDLLIVDDQTGVRSLLYETFAGEGYSVRLADGGKAALAMISQKLPNLIILDLKMPLLNGIETLKELRKTQPDIAVIIMSACGDTEMLEEARVLGVKEYIVKPFDILEIRKLVREFLVVSGQNKV